MNNKIVVSLLTIFLLASAHLPEARQAKFYRVGVILQGGPYYEAINGLRDGLREVGLEEGKHKTSNGVSSHVPSRRANTVLFLRLHFLSSLQDVGC